MKQLLNYSTWLFAILSFCVFVTTMFWSAAVRQHTIEFGKLKGMCSCECLCDGTPLPSVVK